MEFKIGDNVRYIYPNPMNSAQNDFGGIIEAISETHVIIKNEKNIRLKVSFKNFDQITNNTVLSPISESKSENYYG